MMNSQGQGPRKPNFRDSNRERSEFDQKVVEVKRVTRVTSGGKRMRFRALVVIGDHKGKVGMGLRKGMDFSDSVQKAVNAAKKQMLVLPLIEGTIPHDVNVKFNSSKFIIRPAKAGQGIIAGGAVRAVMDLAGVKNIMCKSVGGSNKVNNVKAIFAAFKQLKNKETLAKMRK